MVFFKRVLAADKCWCGSRRAFSKCHRRDDDWSYVTLDPDQRAYSPVILFDRIYNGVDPARIHILLDAANQFLRIDSAEPRASWAVPAQPAIKNEIGDLIFGAIELAPTQLHLETNSEKRFDYLTSHLEALLELDSNHSETRRAEPQRSFPIPDRRHLTLRRMR